MKLTQNWLGYLDRSYETIKSSLLQRLVINNPEITDHTESNILVIIISMFSGIAEVLNLYIDAAARESFIGTARRYTSVVKLSKLMDYKISARIPASVDLKFSLIDSTGAIFVNPGNTFVIPKNTKVISSNGIQYVTNQDGQISTGKSSVTIPARQYTEVIEDQIGVTNGLGGQQIALPDNYANNTITLSINGEDYQEYDSKALLFGDTRGFTVNVEEDGVAYITLGNGTLGYLPVSGKDILATYKTTEGFGGNLSPNTITQITSTVDDIPTGSSLIVINPHFASGGSDFDNIDSIREKAPLAARTLRRAVTYSDYVDIAKLTAGVKDAKVHFCCGKTVDVYVSPISRGIASQSLLEDVEDQFSDKKMVTTFVKIYPAGVSRIWMKAEIISSPFKTENDVLFDLLPSLDDAYGYASSKINRSIKISEIIALVENLSTVDTINISEIYIEPSVKPITNPNVDLGISFGKVTSTSKDKYTLIYKSVQDVFDVYVNDAFKLSIPNNSGIFNYSDNKVSFEIIADTFDNLSQWEFITFPSFPENFPNYTIDVNDFSVPIFDVTYNTDPSLPPDIFSDITITPSENNQFNKPNCG